MNKTVLNFGFLTVTWYAFLIVMSMLLGMFIILNNPKIKDISKKNKDMMYDYFFYLLIFSFLGARTWYVIFDMAYYINHIIEIPQIWLGGLAIHGGIIGGGFYTLYFSRKNKLNFLLITDAVVPALMLGQIIGRFGNFINQEAFGPVTSYDFLKNTMHLPLFIVNGMNIDGEYYQPTFLYESISNLIGLIILVILAKKIKLVKLNFGYITAFYLIWYGTVRTIIEQFRLDALYLGNIRIAQVTSIFMVILGIILIVYVKKKSQNA